MLDNILDIIYSQYYDEPLNKKYDRFKCRSFEWNSHIKETLSQQPYLTLDKVTRYFIADSHSIIIPKGSKDVHISSDLPTICFIALSPKKISFTIDLGNGVNNKVSILTSVNNQCSSLFSPIYRKVMSRGLYPLEIEPFILNLARLEVFKVSFKEPLEEDTEFCLLGFVLMDHYGDRSVPYCQCERENTKLVQ
jgi:hypothetical protein